MEQPTPAGEAPGDTQLTQAVEAVENALAQIAAEPQLAMICMKMSENGQSIDVEMGLSRGQLDMDIPHHFMLKWLADNWEMLTTMYNIAFTSYRDRKNPNKVTDAEPKPEPSRLVDIAGNTLPATQH